MHQDDSGSDRREKRRREVDVEQNTIIDRAVHDAPIVNKLLKTGRIALVVGGCGALLGGAGASLGFRLMAPRDGVAAVQAQVDALKKTTRDTVLPQQQAFGAKLDVLLRLACLDKRTSDHDKQLAGLHCAEIVDR